MGEELHEREKAMKPQDTLKALNDGKIFISQGDGIGAKEYMAAAGDHVVNIKAGLKLREKQPSPKRLVVIESPYSGATEFNTEYARRALADCLERGEAPLASHLLYTQVLCDEVPSEREAGMQSGWAWIYQADAVAMYTDYGITKGMREAEELAKSLNITVEYRRLGGEVE